MSLTFPLPIEPIAPADCDEFFRYLNDHRRENGQSPQGWFIPISRSESLQPYAKEESFRAGLHVPIGSEGWRRAWVARTPERQIAGHVDLRAHPVPSTTHRCLLGMGVHRDHRRRGLGAALLAFAEDWAAGCSSLEWIDLEVLSANAPARRLYQRVGFIEVGAVPEMFRMDGQSFGLTRMAKRIARDQ